jgi:hypothetical protein
MKKIISSACLMMVSILGFAQNPIEAKYARIINIPALKKHLTIIASDSMEGRETGTEGQRKAAAYIEQHFKAIGLQPIPALNGYQQFFPLKFDSVIASSLSIANEKWILGTDFISPISKNKTNQFTSNEIVFVGYGIDDDQYSDYTNTNVVGKLVLIITGEPKKKDKYFIRSNNDEARWDLEMKLQTARDKGAIGALIIDKSMPTFSKGMIMRNSKTGFSFNANNENNVEESAMSYAYISHEAGKKIIGDDFDNIIDAANKFMLLNELKKTFAISVSFNFQKSSGTVNASNVLGVVEGSDKKDEYVFLTAHYDHLGIQDGKIYNGADDDGSGTVTVMQMAQAFAQAKRDGNGPRRTMVFMTVSGEEKGLWGSEYYSEHPLFPLEKTSVDLNTDMIGRVDTERKTADTLNYVYVVGHDKISSELPIINEGMNKKYTNLVLDYKFDDPKDPNRIYYRSDHYNFARKGVPVLFFYDGMLQADYHKPTDDVDKINWPLYQKRAQMIFYTAWEMANRDKMLKRNKSLPKD